MNESPEPEAPADADAADADEIVALEIADDVLVARLYAMTPAERYVPAWVLADEVSP